MAAVSRLSTLFLRTSLVHLAIGTLLGVGMAGWPASHSPALWRPIHAHLLLVGFVVMALLGVSYHILPRISGRPVWSLRLAWWSYGLLVAGLWTLLAGFTLRAFAPSLEVWPLRVGGLTLLSGLWAFAWNAWKTLPRWRDAGTGDPTERPLPPTLTVLRPPSARP